MKNIAFTDKQKQAIALLQDTNLQQIMLYGGSRSGKTFALCHEIHRRAKTFEGGRHAILRWRFNHVKQSVWYDTYAKVAKLDDAELFKAIRRNKSDWFWQYPNGAEVWFGGLDDEERVDKILGNEYATIYLNECSQISEHARDTAMTRLAQNVPGLKPMMFYDCNPSSTRHWSYRDFICEKQPATACLQMNPDDNLANLPEHYIGLLQRLPQRQRERFLHGRFLAEVEGALWRQEWIDEHRASPIAPLPTTCRIVVGVDPAVSGAGDETGIIVAAFDGRDAWARRVATAVKYWQADAVVAEVNQGGDMVSSLLRHHDASLRVINVRASKGKLTRAEPISALYEQGRVKHRGVFELLEEQLTQYTGSLTEESPDRLDALVWALTELFAVEGADGIVRSRGRCGNGRYIALFDRRELLLIIDIDTEIGQDAGPF